MISTAIRDADGRDELGAFLRARRADVDPAAVGLDAAESRRVRGLRREEVAQLASISADYYTRLEQGRLASASASVLDALANALRLSDDERKYLYRLANKGDQVQRRPRDAEGVGQATRQLLENLHDTPAVVLGRHLDVLAWNHLATVVFKDFATVRRQERNFLRMLFLDPEVRASYADWEPLARVCVGFVRAATGAASEPRLAQLIGELSLSDADFRTWWAERHASYAVSGTKTLTHRLTGPFTLDWQVLRLPEDDQILMVMTAPDAASLEALHRVASSVRA
jgi:transcriptional regulator with XRE-family HTH domain